uniref:GDP-fucose protein O-fucosyltransferase 2 n=2 Tax=Ciona savignyi TaxID=51511 RepID=H2YT85_CIOSA
MYRMLRRRIVKRGLELIGAVAVVYLMLEILESHTMDPNERTRNVQVQLPQGGGSQDVAVPLDQMQQLQEQLHQVQREQELQKSKLDVPPAPQESIQQPAAVVPAAPNRQQANEPNSVVIKPNPPQQKPKNEGNDKKSSPNRPNAALKPLSGKGSPDLGVSTNFEKQKIPQPKLHSKGYVLPMLYFDMGPNNLFRLFRQGVVSAYEMGRTVVVPVFHRHPRMGDDATNPFVLPIFDTNYTVDLVWPPSETLDFGALKKTLNAISMKDFKKECKGRLDVLVQCGQVDQKRMDGIRHFQRAADMKVMREIQISNYEELVPNDLSAGRIGPDEFKCMGLIYGKKCLPSQDRWLATYSRIAKSLWRPLPVRKFAITFMEEVMNNKPFMAVHWRYESDWLDMCKPSRPKGARERNKEICKITTGLDNDESLRSSFIQAIKDKMADYNLKVIYLASPPNNVELIRLMKESFPGNFYYMDDVMKFATKKMGSSFLSNNYKTSFVEQEICFRSAFYLGSALSSWTQTILTDRLARNIKRHDSVLSVIGKGAAGFPELVFQFPEGNFNFGGMIPGKKV